MRGAFTTWSTQKSFDLERDVRECERRNELSASKRELRVVVFISGISAHQEQVFLQILDPDFRNAAHGIDRQFDLRVVADSGVRYFQDEERVFRRVKL